MYIRKASFSGIKGSINEISLNFSPIGNSKILSDNIEDFGIEKNALDFKVLKQMAIIGLNASGKTTALMGIQIGMSILCNPFNAQNLLIQHTNIFYNEPFKWFFEFMTKIDGSVNVARKYKIYLTQNKNEIIEEKVTVQEISKTSFKKEKTLYELKDKKIIFDGQTFNHNQGSLTLFSLIRTGQVNEVIKKGLSKYNDLFINLYWTNNDMKNNFFNPFDENLVLPKSSEYLEKLNLLLKAFDPTIKKLYINNLGEPELAISIINNEKTITGFNNIFNILSKGTLEFIKTNKSFFHSLTSIGISFFDELDSSIHSGLFNAIFEILRCESKSQIIFTTHSTEIFNFNLRLDQIMVLNNKNGIIKARRVAEYEGMSDRNATIKKIKQIIENSPNATKMIDIIRAFDE